MSPIAQPASSTVRKKPFRRRFSSREELIEWVKAEMVLPRVQMTLLLAVTGGAGFLTSYLLLRAGLDRMALRYPLAVGVAYLVFFLLLRLWIALQRDADDIASDAVDLGADVVDLGIDVASSAGNAVEGEVPWSGGGGSFGSGGHSSAFGASMPAPRSAPSPKGSSSFDFGFDIDSPAALLVLAIAAAVAAVVLGAMIYVLYLAPILLAEVLVDGVLLVALYRRLKGSEPEHWFFGAVKRTWIPAAVVAFTFFLAGTIFQRLAPEARSIGGVWEAVRTQEKTSG
jgi:hypothetical protein